MRLRRKCRKRFHRHSFQRKKLVNDPGMHHGTCVSHVPWCMSGSLSPRWRGKRSRRPRRTQNPLFHVSDNCPFEMDLLLTNMRQLSLNHAYYKKKDGQWLSRLRGSALWIGVAGCHCHVPAYPSNTFWRHNSSHKTSHENNIIYV